MEVWPISIVDCRLKCSSMGRHVDGHHDMGRHVDGHHGMGRHVDGHHGM